MPNAHETNDIAAEVAKRARDLAYVAVGLGVLGIQRAQAARHELARQDRLDEGLDRLRSGIATGTQQFGQWLEGARAVVSSQLAPLGTQLPEPARELAEMARLRVEEVSSRIRQLTAPGS